MRTSIAGWHFECAAMEELRAIFLGLGIVIVMFALVIGIFYVQ